MLSEGASGRRVSGQGQGNGLQQGKDDGQVLATHAQGHHIHVVFPQQCRGKQQPGQKRRAEVELEGVEWDGIKGVTGKK